jgi:uncharacterized membrane protein YqjE
VFETLHKSKQISVIALDRIGDYIELLQLELKLRGRDLGIQLVCYASAALFAVLAAIFIGVAIIISFWGSDYFALAGWSVVALYLAVAGVCIFLARRKAHEDSPFSTLRSELKRDVDLVKENI